MNLSKYMEFIFLGALALIGATAAATAAVPALLAPEVRVTIVQDSAIPTIIVTAKRINKRIK